MEKQLFETLYRSCYQKLYLYALSLTHNRADAEDLTANTFVKALTTFTQGNLQAWLYTVLRNEFFDWQKRRKHSVSFEDKALENLPGDQDVWQIVLEDERRRWLYRQISRLPRPEQEVLLLTVQTDWKDEQIAAVLGLTAAHVRVLRHRGKKQILLQAEEEPI